MERTWIRESSFQYREGGMKMLRGWGWNFVCVRGLWKIGKVKGESVKSGYRTKDLITWAGAGSLYRDLGILVKLNKKQLCGGNRGSPVSWDPSIVTPGFRVEIFQVITLERQPCEWTKRETRQRGNTLLMPIASNLYIKMAAPGWSFLCNTGIKKSPGQS